MITYRKSVRDAFTLVEMLVAMALTLFVMAILSQAFVAGLETFSGLKSIGDMQQNLRTAMTLIQTDLAFEHIDGGRRLSDASMNSANTSIFNPPREGYFFIRHGATAAAAAMPAAIFEGTDADGLASYRATNHVMGFTIKMRGNKRENVMMSYDIPTWPPPPIQVPPAPQKWSPLSKPQAYSLSAMGEIKDASNASPIVITSLNHGLSSGVQVFIWGVTGNWNANTDYLKPPNPRTPPLYTITVTGAHTFELQGTTGNGVYLGGGTWTIPGGQRRDALHNPGGPPNYDPYGRIRPAPPGIWPLPPLPAPNTQPPPDTFASQWAEVYYFLMRTGSTDDPTNPNSTLGAPLFGLFRAHYLLVPNPKEADEDTNDAVNHPDVYQTTLASMLPDFYSGISCNPFVPAKVPQNRLDFNSAADVADRGSATQAGYVTMGQQARALGLLRNNNVALPFTNTAPANQPGSISGGQPRNCSLVMPNVLSFLIQPMSSPTTPPYPPPLPLPAAVIYDTTQSSLTPLFGVRITLRVYDANMQFSRQLTIVQEL